MPFLSSMSKTCRLAFYCNIDLHIHTFLAMSVALNKTLSSYTNLSLLHLSRAGPVPRPWLYLYAILVSKRQIGCKTVLSFDRGRGQALTSHNCTPCAQLSPSHHPQYLATKLAMARDINEKKNVQKQPFRVTALRSLWSQTPFIIIMCHECRAPIKRLYVV